MRRAEEKVMEKKERFLSHYGQKQLLFYAQILDEIADYYKGGEKEVRFYADREQLWQDRQKARNGRVLGEQMKDMSVFLKQMALQSEQVTPLLEKCRKQLLKRLRENDLFVDELYVKEYQNGRLEVGVFAHAKQGDYFSVMELADYISTIVHRPMEADKEGVSYIHDEPVYVVCRQKLGYRISCKAARATKEGEKESGDNYLVQEYPDGTCSIWLSDGMGSGGEACEDSVYVTEFADKLSEAGFSLQDVIRQVNDVLLLRANGERTASLDLCRLQLFSGDGLTVKCGAAPTYLKSGNYVTKLALESLPLGVMQGEQGRKKAFYFDEGDRIVMVTDGVMEGFLEEKDTKKDGLCRFLESLGEEKPEDMAGMILTEAIRRSKGHIKDDMTVIVGEICSVP